METAARGARDSPGEPTPRRRRASAVAPTTTSDHAGSPPLAGDTWGLTATALVALVLVARSGLPVGLALPAAPSALDLGVLAGADVIGIPGPCRSPS